MCNSPSEREERDRAILAAIEPCRQQYPDFFGKLGAGVTQDEGIRYWYKSHLVTESYEVDRCIYKAVQGLKVGPWLPGRLATAGPTNVSISTSGQEVVVPVRLNGVIGAMAVRRNSDFTVVTPAYAKRAGLQIAAGIRVGSIAVPYARARAVEVGDASVQAVDIAVYEALPDHPTIDGILGKSFLSHFKINIDRRSGRLTLEPARALKRPRYRRGIFPNEKNGVCPHFSRLPC